MLIELTLKSRDAELSKYVAAMTILVVPTILKTSEVQF